MLNRRLLFYPTVLLLLVSALPAQIQIHRLVAERRTCFLRLVKHEKREILATLQLEHGMPVWKPEYEDQSFAGQRVRLGSGAWPRLITDVDLDWEGVEIPAGTWHLALACSKDDEWTLVLFTPEATKDIPALYVDRPKASIHLPLTRSRREEIAPKLDVLLLIDDATPGEAEFAYRFGPFALNAIFTLALPD
ncbi:MAG: hypothetical protein ACYTG5_12970 [Planctomycetota bacterium]|jgi:hypothetical protein